MTDLNSAILQKRTLAALLIGSTDNPNAYDRIRSGGTFRRRHAVVATLDYHPFVFYYWS